MDSDFFNRTALNLVIGLAKGNRWLAPLSTDFRRLGYHVFEIEPRLVTGRGSRNPDALLTSEVTSHSLLGEWTAAELDEGKRQQLIAFARVTDRELVAQLGVPETCVDALGMWIMVPPSVADDYQDLVRGPHVDALVSTLYSPESGGYVLEGLAGTTGITDLDDLLSGPSELRRIPGGYCLICLSDLSWERLAEHVVHALASLARRDELQFDIEVLCRTIVPVWDDLSTGMQKPVGDNVRRVLTQMTRRRYVGRWLRRTRETPPEYEIDERMRSEPRPILEAFRRDLERFLAELAGEPIHLPLPGFDAGQPRGDAGP